VDDISIIYNGKATEVDNMLSEFNILLPKRKFTSVLEKNGKINFLDITVTKLQNSIETATNRNLTTTDCIVPHDSCYLTQRKISGIRYLVNRTLAYPISFHGCNYGIVTSSCPFNSLVNCTPQYPACYISYLNGEDGSVTETQ
jgi:hypothetical protein